MVVHSLQRSATVGDEPNFVGLTAVLQDDRVGLELQTGCQGREGQQGFSLHLERGDGTCQSSLSKLGSRELATGLGGRVGRRERGSGMDEFCGDAQLSTTPRSSSLTCVEETRCGPVCCCRTRLLALRQLSLQSQSLWYKVAVRLAGRLAPLHDFSAAPPVLALRPGAHVR